MVTVAQGMRLKSSCHLVQYIEFLVFRAVRVVNTVKVFVHTSRHTFTRTGLVFALDVEDNGRHFSDPLAIGRSGVGHSGRFAEP
jgi:hypothetical protein